MKSSFKRAIAGSVIVVAAFGSVALSSSVASATETAEFTGTGFGPLTNEGFTVAETNAVTAATQAANTAGFFNCPTHEILNADIPLPPGNKVWRVTVAVTCTR